LIDYARFELLYARIANNNKVSASRGGERRNGSDIAFKLAGAIDLLKKDTLPLNMFIMERTPD